MKYQRMGRSGLQVPPLCLGTMTFGLQVDQATSFNILDEAFEQKLTFLDTADVYPLGGDLSTIGETERIIGEWMKQRGNRHQRANRDTGAKTHRGKGGPETQRHKSHRGDTKVIQSAQGTFNACTTEPENMLFSLEDKRILRGMYCFLKRTKNIQCRRLQQWIVFYKSGGHFQMWRTANSIVFPYGE